MTHLPTYVDDTTQLIRNQTIFASQVDQDLVMLDEKAGLYFGLNSVAHKIWELLANPISYQQLLHALMEAYEVEFAQCKQDVDPFLAKLLQHQLVNTIKPA